MNGLKVSLRGILAFMGAVALPMALLAWFYLAAFERSLGETVLQHVSSLADKKVAQIDDHIQNQLTEMRVQSRRPWVRTALSTLNRAYQKRGLPDTWELDQQFRPEFTSIVEARGFYDCLLINAEGDVVFSVLRESDLGTNLRHGPYRETGLAWGFQEAMETLQGNLTDFRAYAPSKGKLAGFFVAPILEEGRPLGALAFQINMDALTEVVADGTGLGRTGEAIVAQREGEELRYTGPLNRVPSAGVQFRIPLAQAPVPIRLAVEGGHGHGIFNDYSKTEVAAAWRYLPGLNWGLVVKVDTWEAFASLRRIRRLTWLGYLAFLLLSGTLATVIYRGFKRRDAQSLDAERARNSAEAASRAKSRFLSRMSHELRTPLNAIMGFTQLLQMADPSPKQAESLEEIQKAGMHLLDLVEEVLDLSHFESGQLDLALETVDTTRLLESLDTHLRPLAEYHQIAVTLKNGCALWQGVKADFKCLRRILINLAANAIKYNRPGGEVWIEATDLPDGMVRFEVRDTGRGIAPEALERLYLPFERLEQEYSGIDGLGIGLALSQRLAQAMGSRIEAESRLGEGSRFWLDLPGATISTPVQTPTLPKSLLYVEDNAPNRMLMEDIISQMTPFQLVCFSTAEAGLAHALAHPPDLILMDLTLAGMSGLDALQKLKATPSTRGIPVVAVTAEAMPKDVAKGLEAGFSAYITKPLDVVKLLAVLDQHLGGLNSLIP